MFPAEPRPTGRVAGADPALAGPALPGGWPTLPGDVTQALRAIGNFEEGAAARLLPLVYEDLRRHAHHRMAAERPGQTLQPTALVHEAWLRLVRGSERHWQNRAHFFAAAAEAMRRILIENARRRARLKHGAGGEHVPLNEAELPEAVAAAHVLEIDAALEELAAIDAEKARVVTLKFFGGLSTAQVAEVMRLGERTVERHWAYAKAWLFEAIQRGRG
jgi:RNA polymerase sigma factor (TIGR02999 family)